MSHPTDPAGFSSGRADRAGNGDGTPGELPGQPKTTVGQMRSGANRSEGLNAFRTPYGVASAAMMYAMIAKRYMYEHGITENALCEVSLNSYANAQRNGYGHPTHRHQHGH